MRQFLTTVVAVIAVELLGELLPDEFLWRQIGLFATYLIAFPVLAAIAFICNREEVSEWFDNQTHAVRVVASASAGTLAVMFVCGVILLPVPQPAGRVAVAVPKPKSSPLFPLVEYVPAQVLQFSDQPTLTPIPAWVVPEVNESRLDRFNPPVAAVFDAMPTPAFPDVLMAPVATINESIPAPVTNLRILNATSFLEIGPDGSRPLTLPSR